MERYNLTSKREPKNPPLNSKVSTCLIPIRFIPHFRIVSGSMLIFFFFFTPWSIVILDVQLAKRNTFYGFTHYLPPWLWPVNDPFMDRGKVEEKFTCTGKVWLQQQSETMSENTFITSKQIFFVWFKVVLLKFENKVQVHCNNSNSAWRSPNQSFENFYQCKWFCSPTTILNQWSEFSVPQYLLWCFLVWQSYILILLAPIGWVQTFQDNNYFNEDFKQQVLGAMRALQMFQTQPNADGNSGYLLRWPLPQ